MNITLAQSEAAIQSAKKKALEVNAKMNICIVGSRQQYGGICPHGWTLDRIC
jgi:hypothetical protein